VTTNYLLIDYENVQPQGLAALKDHSFKVLVFLGATQLKVSAQFAAALQALGSSAKYIQASGTGSNALDFHIAFTVGQLSQLDSKAYFHIISRDAGFDPLITYMRKEGILAKRSTTIEEVLLSGKTVATSAPSKLEAIIQNLASRTAGKPRTVKTLSSTINALFQRSLDEADLLQLIKALEKGGHISIAGVNVTYHLRNTR
jgi:hypothetical protein